MNTLEGAVAERVARALSNDCLDAEVQEGKGRVVVWVDNVAFSLKVEQLGG